VAADVTRGLTTADIARRYRVGEDRVRAWIRAGELPAINTAATRCGRPRYVVTSEALVEFETRRAAAATPKMKKRINTRVVVDYYP
jgi:transposase